VISHGGGVAQVLTSNRICEKIGYERVCESAEIEFLSYFPGRSRHTYRLRSSGGRS